MVSIKKIFRRCTEVTVNCVEKTQKIPFLRKTLRCVNCGVAVHEVVAATYAVIDPSKTTLQKSISEVRSSCCTGALVSAYFASKSPSPGLAASFHVCCTVCASIYVATGGEGKEMAKYISNFAAKTFGKK